MQNYEWYAKLKKPKWSPPSWLFGSVWTFLYILIFISFGRVFWLSWQSSLPVIIILPFILNLIFNFCFTPIQFGLKNNYLAAADVLLVWLTLIWLIIIIYPIMNWVAYLQIPYLLWVSFAAFLQLNITYLNRHN